MKNMPEIKLGIYEIKYDLGIHRKVGLTCERLRERLESGIKIEIVKIKYLKHSIWGKIEEGWILLYMNDTFYIQM